MASMREIKRRRDSIKNTQQITKAMKLVSTAKLQRARQQVNGTRPYFEKIHQTISSIITQTAGVSHPFLKKRDGNRNLYIVISSNRGLAGGYNNNVGKLVMNHSHGNEGSKIIAIGKKGADYLRKREVEIYEEYHEILDDPNYSHALKLGQEILDLYLKDEIDNVYLAYTHFISTLQQEPRLLKVVPLSAEEFLEEGEAETIMNFEPSPEDVLNAIIPKYVSSIIYGALKEAAASEHGARMTAMDNATSNADEMIGSLTLQYNRARQSAITQEITEIVSGAEAL